MSLYCSYFIHGQIMTAPMQPQNFSMWFTSFSNGTAPANLNSSSKGYQFVSTAPVVHLFTRKKHQANDSKTGDGSCSAHVQDPERLTEDHINEWSDAFF